MISSFQQRGISFLVAPSPGHVFFEQTVFEAEIGHQFLQCQSLGAQILHLACIRLAGRITGQPLLAVRHGLEPVAARASPRNSFDQL